MHSSAFIVFSVSAKFRSSWLESKSVSFLGGFCWVIAREEITWNHLNGNHSQQIDRIGSDRIQVLWMKPKRTAQGRCAGFYVWYLFPAVFFPRFGTFFGDTNSASIWISQFAAWPMSCVALRLINKCAKKCLCWPLGHKTLITNAAKSKIESSLGPKNSNKSEQQLQLEQLLDILVMLMRAMQFRFRL